MHEGAVCLDMQCRGEGTVPEQPGEGQGTRSGGTYGVSSSPSRFNHSPGSPQHIQPWQQSLHLPRAALTSYSLRKPMWDLAAFWAQCWAKLFSGMGQDLGREPGQSRAELMEQHPGCVWTGL